MKIVKILIMIFILSVDSILFSMMEDTREIELTAEQVFEFTQNELQVVLEKIARAQEVLEAKEQEAAIIVYQLNNNLSAGSLSLLEKVNKEVKKAVIVLEILENRKQELEDSLFAQQFVQNFENDVSENFSDYFDLEK